VGEPFYQAGDRATRLCETFQAAFLNGAISMPLSFNARRTPRAISTAPGGIAVNAGGVDVRVVQSACPGFRYPREPVTSLPESFFRRRIEHVQK
jgi:hypothetical protein